MWTRAVRATAGLAVLAAGAVLGGCLGDRAPSDSFYALDTGDPGRRYGSPLLDGPVEVARFQTAGVLGQRAIVYSDGDGPRRQRYGYHLWLDPVGIAVRDGFLNALRRSGAAPRAAGSGARVDAAYRLRGRVTELYHARGGRDAAVVGLEVTLSPAAGGRPLVVDHYRARVATPTPDVEGAARAAGDALTRIAGRFLDDLAQQRQ